MSVFDTKTEVLPRSELQSFASGLPPELAETDQRTRPGSRVFDQHMVSKLSRSGLLIVDPARVVRDLNAQAHAMLAGNGVLGIRQGRLAIERTESQRSIEALLERAVIAAAAGMPIGEAIGIPDRSGATRYALCAVDVDGRDGRVEVLLAVTDFADDTGPARSVLAAVLGLSVREAELAELFARGLGLEEVATMMGIALNTVRVHLQRICLKTNCSGQVALTRLLGRVSSMPLAAAGNRSAAAVALSPHARDGRPFRRARAAEAAGKAPTTPPSAS